MDYQQDILKLLDEQENILQFTEFTSRTALDIGLEIIAMAEKQKSKIAIDIKRCCQQLFHYAFDGASLDNEHWIIRKSRVVERFYRSSLYMHVLLHQSGKSIESYGISPLEYAAFGGAFPIKVKKVGVIGTITVSGLPHDEDHRLVVNALEKYLF